MTNKNTDPVVQTHTCKHCSSSYDITQGDLDFYAKISPKFGEGDDQYVAQIPAPTLCPDCRQRRRLSFRNERKLYRRICDASGQPIISIYSPDKSCKVYDQKIRRSDARDPMDYGREFDFSKTFTQQFGELMGGVPRPSLNIDLGAKSSNSDYTNEGGGNKSCYFVFKTGYASDSLYSTSISLSQDCVDCLHVEDSNNCYECLYCKNCYNCFFCTNCRDSSFCYGSSNLTGAKYVYDNQQLDKDSYFERIKEVNIEIRKSMDEKVIVNCENSTGDRIYDCKNCYACFDVTGAQDCKYCNGFISAASNCYDVHVFGDNLTRALEIEVGGTNSDLIAFSIHTNSSSSVYLSHFTTNCSNIFGCIGLRNKSYCIFNKQYTKQEYNELVPKIIEHMKIGGERGEFFDPSLSPFGYNETVAQEYYPLSISDNVSLIDDANGLDYAEYGYHRSDYESPAPQSDKIIHGSKLPTYGCQTIHDNKPEYLQDILKYAIRCEVTDALFRLQPQEIQFYIKHDIPLPRKHPDQRHKERMTLRR